MRESSTYFRNALLIAVILGLCAYSLLFIYSTGYIGDEYPVRLNWQRQAFFIGAGLLLAMPVSCLLCRSWLRGWYIYGGYAISLASLLLVLVLGHKTGGATRWLAVGSFIFQPAEYAKVFTVLALALRISSGNCGALKSLLLSLAFAMPPMALIMVEPSYGSAAAMLPPVAVILLMHIPGRRLLQFTILGTLLIMAVLAAGLLWLRTEQGSKGADKVLAALSENRHFLKDYHVRRIKGYLDKTGDWNERQSVLTISSGGSSGKGYLQGTMKGLGYLPRTVAPTDFIFAVICEEFGFFYGALPVILLYIILLCLLICNGTAALEERNLLFCTGVAMLLFMHIAINLAMTMRLLPVIGLPLPLLSYGGSYATAVFAGLGAAMAGKDSQLKGDVRHSFTLQLGRLLRFSINEMNIQDNNKNHKLRTGK